MKLFCADFEPELIPALGEALTNCLLNADYHGGGVEVRRTVEAISFVNAGQFRVDVTAAVSGGISDPRNLALSRLFARMGVGRGSGSGLAEIHALWRSRGWAQPTIRETFDPTQVMVRLPLTASGAVSQPTGILPHSLQRSVVLAYITEHIRAEESEIAAYLNGDQMAVSRCLEELLAEGVLTEELPGVYRLKR